MAAEEVRFVFDMDDKFSDKAKQAEKQGSSLDKTLGSIGKSVAAAFSIGAVVNFTKSIVESYGEMEAFKVALTTMLRGQSGMAEALNDQLITLAKTTPFQLSDVQQGTRQLIAYGFAAGDVIKTMKTLGDVSAGVGAPLQDVAYLYGTLKTQDKVMSKDLYQFANRGIPILEMLAKRFKTTTAAIFDLASEGSIHFKDIEWAFTQMTSKGGQFFNLMEAQSKTVKGQLSNLADSWDQLKVAIGESQSGIIKSTVAWASEMVSAMEHSVSRTNFMVNAIRKGGGNETTYLGSTEEKQGEYERLADMVLKSVEKGGKSKEDAIFQREFLKNLLQTKNANWISEMDEKNITDPKMLINYYGKQQQAVGDIIKSGIDKLNATLKLKGTSTDVKESLGVDQESKKAKTPHYTQINITIEKMAGIEKVENVTEQQAAILTAEQITKFMVKAVEDAQIIAGK